VLGGGEAEAVVRAIGAGCDCLLYPSKLEESLRAIEKAIDDKRLDADAIQRSLERRMRWARWTSLSKDAYRPARDESGWATQLAERVVHPLRGRIPRLAEPWHLVVVDDDIGGPYPAPPRDPLITGLRTGGADIVVDDEAAPDGTAATVIALFGDIRAWKGRPGFSAKAKEAVQRAIAAAADKSDCMILQFSHPRLASELETDVPILCAWGGEAVMQRAAARVMLRQVRGQRAQTNLRTAG
jgi:hypothetical protein